MGGVSPQVWNRPWVLDALVVMAKKCKYSPDGEHEGETSEVVVTKKGKKVTILASVCRWCGKILSR